MIVMALVGLAALGSQAATTDDDSRGKLHVALECRVYSQMAMDVDAGKPAAIAMDRKINQYWSGEAQRIAGQLGLSAKALEIQELIIPVKAERFTPVMLNCLDMAPKEALR